LEEHDPVIEDQLKSFGAQYGDEEICNEHQGDDEHDEISHILEPPAQAGIEHTNPEEGCCS
jgi:hypothetical protein